MNFRLVNPKLERIGRFEEGSLLSYQFLNEESTVEFAACLQTKCDQYWPNRGTETFGEMIHVTANETQEFAYYILRSFTIQMVGQIEKREIKHLQFTAWPDHGVPEHPAPLLTFIRRVRSFYTADMGPVIVHCR